MLDYAYRLGDYPMTDTTLAELAEKIAKAKTALEHLNAEHKRVSEYTPAQNLAIVLHKKLYFGHSDDGWHYEENWNCSTHRYYLHKAYNIVGTIKQFCDCSDENAFALANKLVEAL